MGKYKSNNGGNYWILTAVEVLSRYAFTIHVYRKDTKNKTKTVNTLLEQLNMKWNTNTEKVVKNAAKRLLLLKELKSYGAGTSDTKNFYIAVIRPTLEHGAQVWNGGITKD